MTIPAEDSEQSGREHHVAEAVARVLDGSGGVDRSYYELGGPHIYTYRDPLQSIALAMGTRV